MIVQRIGSLQSGLRLPLFFVLGLSFCCGLTTATHAQAEDPPLGIAMETWDYPHAVHYRSLTVDGQDVRMAYMDVSPESADAEPDRPAVVLMHGKSILEKTEEGIREDLQSYFVDWKPEYEQFVEVHYRWTLGGEYPRLAWSSALTAQMIYEQPVVHQFGQVQPPALLVIGQQDRTALGKGRVGDDVAATLGQYPQLGKRTAEAIPQAKLVELEEIGHIPHLEAPQRFHQALVDFLGAGD